MVFLSVDGFSNNPVTLRDQDAMAGASAGPTACYSRGNGKDYLVVFLSWADWVMFLTPQTTAIPSQFQAQHDSPKPFLTPNKALLPSLSPHELFDFKPPFSTSLLDRLDTIPIPL